MQLLDVFLPHALLCSTTSWPILACKRVSSASPVACTASALPENVDANPSIACRFQAAIIVWWMPCLADNSAKVCSPRSASNATLALNSAP